MTGFHIQDRRGRSTVKRGKSPTFEEELAQDQIPEFWKQRFSKLNPGQQRAWIAEELKQVSTRREMQQFMGRYVDIIAENPQLLPKIDNIKALRDLDSASIYVN